jgi:hypothetical protein
MKRGPEAEGDLAWPHRAGGGRREAHRTSGVCRR